MNILLNRIFSFALLAAAAGTGAAQAAQQATFHLPYEAKWGNVTLAPGDYKMALPQISLGQREFLLRGENMNAWVMPMTTDVDALSINPSDKNYLQLVNVDGVFFVSRYQAGTNSVIFNFKVPKSRHKEWITNREVTKIEVGGL
jgi:hypothetical protein